MSIKLSRKKLIKSIIRSMFWAQTDDYDTSEFETPENIEVANRAIDIAKQQLPIRCVHDPKAIYQRCVELFRLGGYYWYKNWC